MPSAALVGHCEILTAPQQQTRKILKYSEISRLFLKDVNCRSNERRPTFGEPVLLPLGYSENIDEENEFYANKRM